MRQTVADALRSRVGRGKQWSVTDFAEAVRASESSVENWRSEAASPTIEAYAAMCAVLGDSFRDEVTPTSAPEVACMPTVASASLRVSQEYIDASADGEICPRERARFGEALRRLVDLGTIWLRGNK